MSSAQRDELIRLVSDNHWMLRVLQAARVVNAPHWWIGAGVVRDLVWDTRVGGFDPERVKDVDLAFFDPADLRRERDEQVEHALREEAPDIPCDAKNQAAVHTWYANRFGVEVEPLRSVADAVATWPETATAVAVRLDQHDRIQVLAPFGLDDLFDGVWRHNPRRVTVDEFRRRLAKKQVHRRWPHVQVVLE
jgi:uncharacterized protein